MSRRHRLRSSVGQAAAPMNDIEAARARADAAIQAAAAPPSPEQRVMELEQRLDRWVNYATGLGTLEDKTRAASFEPPWRLSDVEITSLASGNDLAAKCISKRPDEMFRRGYSIDGQKPGTLDKGRVDELSAYATEDLLADTRLHEGMQYGRQYGGALCILGVNDGRPMDQPVDEDNIHSVDFINTIDRRFAYAQSYYSNLGEPGLGTVETYLVSNGVATSSYRSTDGTKFGYRQRTPDQIKRATPGSSSLLVHESRVIRFDGIVADLITRQTLAGWSWSVLQLPFETLRMCDGAFDALAYLISDASQGVLKLKGLFAAISGGKEKNLQQRLDTMDRLKSVMHTIALDADGQESFERTTTSFAGLPEAIDRIMQRLAAAMDMPVTELFGISPAGLNATGEGDRIKWYDTIATEQRKALAPKLKRLYRLLSLAADGPFKGRGADFKITFHPLYAPTDDELAKTRLSNAQRDIAYVTAEVVTPQQVALTLTDIYPSINADEIEEAIEDKVKFDPLENDPHESDDVQAKIAATAAAKPAAPSPFGALAAKPGVAKATPASARESTPAKAQAGAPSTPAKPVKKTGTSDRRDRWNPDQPRDEHGRWSEEEAVTASRQATETSRFAMTFGGHEEHDEASKAHAHAATLAHALAAKHVALGNTKAAEKFSELAKHHESMAASHTAEADKVRPDAPPPPPKVLSRAVNARARGGIRSVETRAERDEAVKVNLPAHLHPLWEKTKGNFKGTPQEREDHFTHYAEEHAHEAVGAMQTEADARLEDLIHEYESRRADGVANREVRDEVGRPFVREDATEWTALVWREDFDPDQPRDANGKFSDLGSGAARAASKAVEGAAGDKYRANWRAGGAHATAANLHGAEAERRRNLAVEQPEHAARHLAAAAKHQAAADAHEAKRAAHVGASTPDWPAMAKDAAGAKRASKDADRMTETATITNAPDDHRKAFAAHQAAADSWSQVSRAVANQALAATDPAERKRLIAQAKRVGAPREHHELAMVLHRNAYRAADDKAKDDADQKAERAIQAKGQARSVAKDGQATLLGHGLRSKNTVLASLPQHVLHAANAAIQRGRFDKHLANHPVSFSHQDLEQFESAKGAAAVYWTGNNTISTNAGDRMWSTARGEANHTRGTAGNRIGHDRVFGVSQAAEDGHEGSRERMVAHELAHHIHLGEGGVGANGGGMDPAIKAAYEARVVPSATRGKQGDVKPGAWVASQYATTNHREWFAETHSAYLYHPTELKKKDGEAFKLMKRARQQIGLE